jgi:hypothetical protein
MDQDRLERQAISEAFCHCFSALRSCFHFIISADANMAGKHFSTCWHCWLRHPFDMDRKSSLVGKWHVLNETIRKVREAGQIEK